MPNFGYEIVGVNKRTLKNYIHGCYFECPENGVAESITVVLEGPTGVTRRVKCAIYRWPDRTLIATTMERTVTTNGIDTPQWETFNFTEPKPNLVANTKYLLATWAENVETYTRSNPDPEMFSRGGGKEYTYNSFPDPISLWMMMIDVSIYCTYTTLVTHTLTITTTVGGTTNPAPRTYLYDGGAIATVTAIPESGYQFDHWELDGITRIENPTDVIMDKNYTLNAVFVVAPPEHSLTVQATPVNVPVTLNGAVIGNTPISVAVKEGEHAISVPQEVQT